MRFSLIYQGIMHWFKKVYQLASTIWHEGVLALAEVYSLLSAVQVVAKQITILVSYLFTITILSEYHKIAAIIRGIKKILAIKLDMKHIFNLVYCVYCLSSVQKE